jgi:hypothetical protein
MEKFAYVVIGGALGVVLTLSFKTPQSNDNVVTPAMKMDENG